MHVPLKLRYKLRPSSLWMLPLNSLLTVLEISLPILLSGKTTVNLIWDELLVSLQDFLFSEMYVKRLLYAHFIFDYTGCDVFLHVR